MYLIKIMQPKFNLNSLHNLSMSNETENELTLVKITIVKEEHNTLDQVTYREFSNGSWLKWEYDDRGLMTGWVDEEGAWGKWEYNEQGLEIKWENSKGEWGRSEYNEQGLKTRYEDSDRNWSKIKYDDVGRMTRAEYSDGECLTYEFDANGNPILMTPTTVI